MHDPDIANTDTNTDKPGRISRERMKLWEPKRISPQATSLRSRSNTEVMYVAPVVAFEEARDPAQKGKTTPADKKKKMSPRKKSNKKEKKHRFKKAKSQRSIPLERPAPPLRKAASHRDLPPNSDEREKISLAKNLLCKAQGLLSQEQELLSQEQYLLYQEQELLSKKQELLYREQDLLSGQENLMQKETLQISAVSLRIKLPSTSEEKKNYRKTEHQPHVLLQLNTFPLSVVFQKKTPLPLGRNNRLREICWKTRA